MPSYALSNLGLNTGWTLGEDGWKAGVDHNWLLLDTLVQGRVISVGLETPPVTPTAGECYILGAAPTGVFTGMAHNIVIRNDATWVAFVPLEGWKMYDRDSGDYYQFNGTAWVVDSGGGGGGTGTVESVVAGAGIEVDNADPANPVVSAPLRWDAAVSLSPTAGVVTLDLSSPAGFVVTMSENITTLNFNSAPAGRYVVFAVTFVQDATGGRTVTYPAAVQGSPVQPAAGANAITVMSFVTWNAGATIYQAS